MALSGHGVLSTFPFRRGVSPRTSCEGCLQLAQPKLSPAGVENHERKEVVNIESCTIRHVFALKTPGLSHEWQLALGSDWKEIQAGKYLHTIGNLTLTGYNPELSDEPFRTKRDMSGGGFRESPLKLNPKSGDARGLERRRDRAARRGVGFACCENMGVSSSISGSARGSSEGNSAN